MTKQASSRLPEFSQRWKPREPGTCDLDQIRHWCDEGVPIGFHPAAAGQCVIQIEPGIPIPVSLPETRAVRTPEGALQLYYAVELELPPAELELSFGIAVLDTVLLDASPGYTIVNSRDPVPAPSWVVRRLVMQTLAA